ncbi:hypothetical protein AB0D32_27665 [Micromonospora sp. NPDC048170]|uniref:hypothetical protein n=1 Tax=Micromonospora sp. NPDC048170 TaxID=3154819 RepID=UPI0033E11436
MSYDTNSGAGTVTPATEKFIDLDDLDFAALEVEGTDEVAGGFGFRWTDWCSISKACGTAGCNDGSY